MIEHSPSSLSRQDYQWSLIWSIGYLFILPAVIYSLILLFVDPNPLLGLISQLIAGVIALTAIVIRHPRYWYQQLRWKTKNEVFWVLLGILMLIGSGLLFDLMLQWLVPGGIVNSNQQALIDLARLSPVLTGVLTLLIAPIMEEVIFRGLLFTSLNRSHSWLAWWVSALGFAAIHGIASIGSETFIMELATLPAYVAASVILTWVHWRSSNVLYVIATHIGYNAIIYFILLAGV